MRLPAFALLAFVASGCTIHVVEQPASPVAVVAAPQPAPVYAAPARPVVVVAEPVAPPAPVVAPTPTPVAMPIPPRRAERPHVTPVAKPWRVPYRTTVAPETRSPRLARIAGPTKRNVPKKTKLPEPVALASTSVAKPQ
ncbi:MAG TPA: hypothetical protein VHP33_18245 [Polyangiaceae bacterium]|nr:hypothetical protein [Polyangiaceae bacterium]